MIKSGDKNDLFLKIKKTLKTNNKLIFVSSQQIEYI